MPTAERRFHLGLLVKNKQEENERIEQMKNNQSTGKGSKQTKVSGDALKSKIKSGEIPLK
jgi:hypothetical protein